MDINLTGRLENWEHQPEMYNIMWGDLYDDINTRWPDGTRIRTSSLSHPKTTEFKEGDVIRTRNSTYLLGKKLEIE
jgi:hypothetical protein